MSHLHPEKGRQVSLRGNKVNGGGGVRKLWVGGGGGQRWDKKIPG